MSAKFCIVVLLITFSLAQVSTAFKAGLSVENANGASSCQIDTISAESIASIISFMGSPRDGWTSVSGSAIGSGYIDRTFSCTTSGGASAFSYLHADNGEINVQDQGTAFLKAASLVPKIDVKGTNIKYYLVTKSMDEIKKMTTTTEEGSVSFSGSLSAGGGGSTINTFNEGIQTLANGLFERSAFNEFGYANLKLSVVDGSLTLEPLKLNNDEVMSWHLYGSGSLAEMFIQAVNKNGASASIHARSPGFIEAYPLATVTENDAKVTA